MFVLITNSKLHGCFFHVILLESYTSVLCWNNSHGMSLRVVVRAIFMISIPSKRTLLMIPWSLVKRKNHLKQDQVNMEIVPIRRCSSHLGTAGCSTHQVPSLFKNAQIFIPNSPRFHLQLTCDHSNSQPTITADHLPNWLNVDINPVC